MAKKRPPKQRPTPTRLKKKNKSMRKRTREANDPDNSLSKPVRLQRILANAGFGSRRECEELITDGRVQVDDKIVQTLGAKANPDTQKIFVDGQKIKFARRQYFALNKPPGVLSTSKDPSGRAKAIDLIQTDQRVYTVGRLDKSSEGLIIVTNDGDFANLLTHPKFGVEKTYHVNVAGSPRLEDLQLLKDGIYLAEGFAKVERIKIRKRRKNYTELEMVLDEGRNREIRRLLAKIGHKVLRLRRVAIGNFKLGELPVGGHRRLTRDEIEMLRECAFRSAKSSSHTDSRKAGRKSVRSKSTGERERTGGRPRRPGQSDSRSDSRPNSRSKSAGSSRKKTVRSRSDSTGTRKKKSRTGGTRSDFSSRSKAAGSSRKKTRPGTGSTGSRKKKSHTGGTRSDSSSRPKRSGKGTRGSAKSTGGPVKKRKGPAKKKRPLRKNRGGR